MAKSESSSSTYNSTWVDAKFLEPRLQNYYKDSSLKILKIKTESACGAGDGYGGILLRLYVTFKSDNGTIQETSYIFKTQVWNELTLHTQKHYNIVLKELELYKSVLPRIKQLLVEIGNKDDIFPDTISVDEDIEVLIMEDLKVKNYVMLDRIQGIDRAHLRLFMERLAQIHAASAVLYEKDPKIYDICPFGMFNRITKVYHGFFYNFWDAMCSEIGSWFGYDYYANKLRTLRSEFIENVCRVYDNDPGDFCVLTHGDLWTNNVMFRYAPNRTPSDAIFVSNKN